jgi:hypothetical protein
VSGQTRYDAERLRVTLESVRRAVRTCDLVELLLGDVSERRVPKVVDVRRRLHNIRVQPAQGLRLTRLFATQFLGEAPRDLRDLQCVGESVVKEVSFCCAGDLGNAREPSVRVGVEHTIAIELEFRPLLRFVRPWLLPIFATQRVPASLAIAHLAWGLHATRRHSAATHDPPSSRPNAEAFRPRGRHAPTYAHRAAA